MVDMIFVKCAICGNPQEGWRVTGAKPSEPACATHRTHTMSLTSVRTPTDLFVGYQLRHPNARVPAYANPGDAGADLFAAEFGDVRWKDPAGSIFVEGTEGGRIVSVILRPGTSVLVHTGLAIAIPDGYEATVRPRSGMAFKHGVTMFHPIGTIDSPFRGTMDVILTNRSADDYPVKVGDRVAQIVFTPVGRATFQAQDLDREKTARDTRGYGSSGT